MRRPYNPKLNEQTIVPHFNLPSNKGTTVSPWDYKQKSNLVMFFFQNGNCSECRRILAQFAANYPRYQDMATQVLAISIMPVEEAKRIADDLSLPFPVLADETGKVTEQCTYVDPTSRRPVPAVFVVDRFGALYFQTIAENEAGLPTQEEITDWLNLIELQCPECGVSEWGMPG